MKQGRVKTLASYILIAFLAIVAYVGILGTLEHFSNGSEESTNGEKTIACASPRVSEKTAILRVDDIQAFTLAETSRRMIEDAEARGVVLSLGVIPVHLEYDTDLIAYLKAHACNLEFALHGWDHSAGEDGTKPEFGSLTSVQAKARIEPGLKNLSLITSEPIVTWIPPFNAQSPGTIDALHNLGFYYLSAEGKGAWDYDASTFEYTGDALVPTEKTLADCDAAVAVSRHCVIMLHPQDFTTGLDHDETTYRSYYIGLLDGLKERGYTFARFKDMPRE